METGYGDNSFYDLRRREVRKNVYYRGLKEDFAREQMLEHAGGL